MTRVQLHFHLSAPLDERQLELLGEAPRNYGLQSAALEAAGDSLTVDYDASRLTAKEVEAILRRLGVPIDGGQA